VRNLLEDLLSRRPWLLADGGMGSGLFERGLESGYPPELWNVEHPERIADVHRSFVAAGADIILTNSFGGTRHRLKLHKAEGRVDELNQRAARVARGAAADAGREVVIAGSMGPTGEIMEPLGPLTIDEATAAFAEQAAALVAGGVDALWIETLSSVEELDAAIAGAKTTGAPIVTTFSFDTNGRTMMGITPAELAGIQRRSHVYACGSNCGTGAAELVASIVNLSNAADADAVLVAKANCGIPRYVDGAIKFDGTPELMATYARLAFDAGARIIGGCCGTTAEHVRAMRAALEQHVRGARPDANAIEALLGPITDGTRAQLDPAFAEQRAAAAAAGGGRAASPRSRRGRS
jgi:methionine synthase I (cobalamin-dependent)